MNGSRRVIACTLVALALLGPLPLRALAQQPAPPPVQPSTPAVVEVMPPERQTVRATDIYDVGAGVVTVARLPFNAVLCGLGAVAGTVLFLVTFGSAYKSSTRAIEEGCASQPWIVRGDDLRPRGAPGIFPSGSSEQYHGR